MKRMSALVLVSALLAGFVLTGLPSQAAEETVDIWKAAWTGNLEVVNQQLATGTDVNAKAPSVGVTPLMAAAIAGQDDAARLLIGKGAKTDIKNNEGSTALHMAAFFGHIDIVKALVAKRADLNVVNDRSETPLDAVSGVWSDGASGRAVVRQMAAAPAP